MIHSELDGASKVVCASSTVDHNEYVGRESEENFVSSTVDHDRLDTNGSEAICGEEDQEKILVQEKSA